MGTSSAAAARTRSPRDSTGWESGSNFSGLRLRIPDDNAATSSKFPALRRWTGDDHEPRFQIELLEEEDLPLCLDLEGGSEVEQIRVRLPPVMGAVTSPHAPGPGRSGDPQGDLPMGASSASAFMSTWYCRGSSIPCPPRGRGAVEVTRSVIFGRPDGSR
jgi:hypothetical protein